MTDGCETISKKSNNPLTEILEGESRQNETEGVFKNNNGQEFSAINHRFQSAGPGSSKTPNGLNNQSPSGLGRVYVNEHT